MFNPSPLGVPFKLTPSVHRATTISPVTVGKGSTALEARTPGNNLLETVAVAITEIHSQALFEYLFVIEMRMMLVDITQLLFRFQKSGCLKSASLCSYMFVYGL